MKRKFPYFIFVLCFFAFINACTAKYYSLAPTYIPLEQEFFYIEESENIDFEEVNSTPDSYRNDLISWFGIVKDVKKMNDGRHKVVLGKRQYSSHFCRSSSDFSCRVTVGDIEEGVFEVYVSLDARDISQGIFRVKPMTLMRVFGKLSCNHNGTKKQCQRSQDGHIILHGVYYRKWPVNYYFVRKIE